MGFLVISAVTSAPRGAQQEHKYGISLAHLEARPTPSPLGASSSVTWPQLHGPESTPYASPLFHDIPSRRSHARPVLGYGTSHHAAFIEHFAQQAARKRISNRRAPLNVRQHAAFCQRMGNVRFLEPAWADNTKFNIAGILRGNGRRTWTASAPLCPSLTDMHAATASSPTKTPGEMLSRPRTRPWPWTSSFICARRARLRRGARHGNTSASKISYTLAP